MKKMIKWSLMICAPLFLAISCDAGTDAPEPGGKFDLELKADKEFIMSDSQDAVTFTVMYGEEDVTSSATIVNVNKTEAISGNTFTTGEAGKVEFYAKYETYRSATISVDATDSGLAIKSDKPNLLFDGEETALLSVVIGARDVTDDPETKIFNETAKEYLERDADGHFTYKMTSNEPVAFSATYKTYDTDELFYLTVPFYKTCGMLRLTATWCGPCTSLATALSQAETQYPDRLAYAAIHCSGDPMMFNGYGTIGSSLGLGSSIPVCSFDFREKVVGSKSAAALVNIMKTIVADNPANTGIKVESSVSGTTATVKVTVRANATRTYGLAVALLEDNVPGEQAGVTGTYYHNKTMRALQTGHFGDDLGEVKVGNEITKTYTLDLSKCATPANALLLVYTTTNGIGHGTVKTVIDNATYAAVNGTTDLKYETSR